MDVFGAAPGGVIEHQRRYHGSVGFVVSVLGAESARSVADAGELMTAARECALSSEPGDYVLLTLDTTLDAAQTAALVRVATISEHHGIVCARGTVGALARFPVGGDGDADSSRRLYERQRAHLSLYGVAPHPSGPVALLRRDLLRNYPAPSFRTFTRDVNRRGFSTVLAHQVFVDGGADIWAAIDAAVDPDTTPEDRAEDDAVMALMAAQYLRAELDVADRFARHGDGTSQPTLLLDLRALSSVFDGTSRNALTLLTQLAARPADAQRATIITSTAARDFFNLARFGIPTLTEDALDGPDAPTFDIGLVLTAHWETERMRSLAYACARLVVMHLDIIALRVHDLRAQSPFQRQMVADAVRLADVVITISEAARRDLAAYLPADALDDADARIRVILQGAAVDGAFTVGAALPDQVRAVMNEPYVLVVGNQRFWHKQMDEATAQLADLAVPVIALGSAQDRPNVVAVRSGGLSDAAVMRLYEGAGCVVFPSCYEGFGLPIADAGRAGVPLVAFDTAVSREVAAHLGLHATFVRTFAELPSVVSRILAEPVPPAPRPMRTIADFCDDVLAAVIETAALPTDDARLRARVAHARMIDAYTARSREGEAAALAIVARIRGRLSRRVGRVLRAMLSRRR